jgi:5'-nucleotidase
MINRWVVVIGLGLASIVLFAQNGPVDVEILAINDFHGNLKPPGTLKVNGVDVEAGGSEYLATLIKTLRAKNPNNILVGAGDMVGASPLVSAVFHDEVTIEALDMMGLAFTSVGNHEFDEGKDELLRKQNGGCHPVDGCRNGSRFDGAKFKYLAANVVNKDTGKALFPAYQIQSFGGIPVAFIGMTLKATPTIVSPRGVAGLEFRDEVETVNHLVPELKAQGVEAMVVLIHEGGRQKGDYNDCKEMAGPIVDIVNRLDKAVDVVISGHTHEAYNCTINGKLLTSASSFGRVLTEIDMRLDPRSHDVVAMKAQNFVVRHDVAKDAAQTALITTASNAVAPLANRVIGSASAELKKDANLAGESPLGDIIADSQLEATRDPSKGGAQIAFMNSGGIRASVQPSGGKVTYEQIFTTQPFGNSLVTMSLRGSDIHDLLEQQWSGGNLNATKVLQVSEGFTYTWDAAKPSGQRVDPQSIRLNGKTIDAAALYRITANIFLAQGGDNFTVLTRGSNLLGAEQDLDVFEQYFKAHAPVKPGPLDRIQRLN